MSQLILAKVTGSGNRPALCHAVCCRVDPTSAHHGAYVDEQGVLHYFHIDASSRSTLELLRFQLQYQPAANAPYEPLYKPWMFEFVPALPGGLMLVQQGSSRILYACLPRQGHNTSDLFLFGSHNAPVTCLASNGDVALSGCSSGSVKLWRVADGQLAAEASGAAQVAITAISFVNPLLAAVGSSAGSIVLYDIAAGHLLAVERFMVASGPVSSLVSWSSQQLHASCDPGELQQQVAGADGAYQKPVALLAAASSAGWLYVYQASQPGSLSWQLHSSKQFPSAITALAIDLPGKVLAVAMPSPQALDREAVAVTAAGGQSGLVSLYGIAKSSSSSSNGSSGSMQRATAAVHGSMQHRLISQQQPQALQILHEWSLRSVPVSIDILPSNPEVLHLLVVSALGPALVLSAAAALLQQDFEELHQSPDLQAAAAAEPSLQQQDKRAVATAAAGTINTAAIETQYSVQGVAAGTDSLAQNTVPAAVTIDARPMADEQLDLLGGAAGTDWGILQAQTTAHHLSMGHLADSAQHAYISSSSSSSRGGGGSSGGGDGDDDDGGDDGGGDDGDGGGGGDTHSKPSISPGQPAAEDDARPCALPDSRGWMQQAKGASAGTVGRTGADIAPDQQEDAEIRPRQVPALLLQRFDVRAADATSSQRGKAVHASAVAAAEDSGSSGSNQQQELQQHKLQSIDTAQQVYELPGRSEQQQRQQQQQEKQEQQRQQQGHGAQHGVGTVNKQQDCSLQQMSSHHSALNHEAGHQDRSRTLGACDEGMGAAAVASHHPLATATPYSSLLLAQKMQLLAYGFLQSVSRQEVMHAPSVLPVDAAAPVVARLSARLMQLDPDEHLYSGLTNLGDVSTPTRAQKVVPKQLDARWLASRALRPHLSTLQGSLAGWDNKDALQNQVLLLPVRQTPEQVVRQLVWGGGADE